MTQREFYIAIENGTEITAELKEQATKLRETLDAKNAQKSAKARLKNETENAPIIENFLAYLEDKADVTASEIAKAVDVSTQKVSALCKKLVVANRLVTTEVKVKGGRKCIGYTIADE